MARIVDDTHAALRDAAIRLLATEGPSALTVRRIAAEAGVSTMNVYSRFGGKDGIVEELFVDGFERLEQAMRATPSTDDPLTDLRACGQAYRTFAEEHPTSYAVMFDAAVPDHEHGERAMVAGQRALGLLVERVRRALDAGQLHGDAAQIAVSLWAANHGLVSLEMKGAGPPTIDWPTQHRVALAAVLRGFMAAPTDEMAADAAPAAPAQRR
jgi:AcrR family transcriptional regulator